MREKTAPNWLKTRQTAKYNRYKPRYSEIQRSANPYRAFLNRRRPASSAKHLTLRNTRVSLAGFRVYATGFHSNIIIFITASSSHHFYATFATIDLVPSWGMMRSKITSTPARLRKHNNDSVTGFSGHVLLTSMMPGDSSGNNNLCRCRHSVTRSLSRKAPLLCNAQDGPNERLMRASEMAHNLISQIGLSSPSGRRPPRLRTPNLVI
jgi:hypothetical protein